MPIGNVEIRIDFIQNAELKSPNEAQQEFFLHQYLSLLCTVVQWKTLDSQNREVLRTRTYMFCSHDRRHDGVFAAACLRHLLEKVHPS